MKYLASLLLLLSILSLASADNITIVADSAVFLPIANITVSYYNITGDLDYVNTTNILGNVTAFDVTGDSYVIKLVYPSSAYSARIDSINASTKVFLGDMFGTTVRLVNTLGQPLEAQDCSVSIYRNDTNVLIKWYDTTCRQGERYVDTSGNDAAVTNCPLTDSYGNYFFTTKILQEDGFEYGRYYDVKVTCNAQMTSSTFYVDVQKPPDVEMWTDWGVRFLGVLAFVLALGLVGLLVLVVVLGLFFFVVKKLFR